MHASIRIFASIILVSFGITGIAGETVEPAEEQAQVILAYDGLFVGASTAPNLVVMEKVEELTL